MTQDGMFRPEMAASFGSQVAWLEKPDDDQRHVIVPRGAGGESVGGGHDARDHFSRGEPRDGLQKLTQRVLAPLFAGRVHGFADAVGEADEDVAGLDGENAVDEPRGPEETSFGRRKSARGLRADA